MQRVSGIGGFFFRAENPEALAAWYATHLGVDEVPTSYDAPVWTQAQGPTVFAPFARDTEYFGGKNKSWMLNFRVENLPAMVRQLEAARIEVEVDPKEQPNGWFARLTDPEGNPIELWQSKPTGTPE